MGDVSKQAYEKYDYIKNNSIMMNSEEFKGMPVKKAKQKIIVRIIKLGFGKKQIKNKMQDWLFNRQRYSIL